MPLNVMDSRNVMYSFSSLFSISETFNGLKDRNEIETATNFYRKKLEESQRCIEKLDEFLTQQKQELRKFGS